MKISVLTTAVRRPDLAARYWPIVRRNAGADIVWSIVIDGSPEHKGKRLVTEDDTFKLMELAKQYADVFTVNSDNVGVVKAMTQAKEAIDCTGARIKLDGDILPSPGFAQGFIESEKAWQDGKLGYLCALKYPVMPRHDIGPRRMSVHYRMPSGLSYLTDLGAEVIDNHIIPTKHFGIDVSYTHKITDAGLWFGYTHRVWIQEHPWFAESEEDALYVAWKRENLHSRMELYGAD